MKIKKWQVEVENNKVTVITWAEFEDGLGSVFDTTRDALKAYRLIRGILLNIAPDRETKGLI